MAGVQEIQDRFYSGIEDKLTCTIYYSQLIYKKFFEKTLKYRFSLINYHISAAKADKSIEMKFEFDKRKNIMEYLWSDWRKYLRFVDKMIKCEKLDTMYVSNLAERNIELSQKILNESSDPETIDSCMEVKNTSVVVSYLMALGNMRKSLIDGSESIYRFERYFAQFSAEAGYGLIYNIPILRKAVELGCIDQEDAHLAIIKGVKKSRE
jgi:hypothetical protein